MALDEQRVIQIALESTAAIRGYQKRGALAAHRIVELAIIVETLRATPLAPVVSLSPDT